WPERGRPSGGATTATLSWSRRWGGAAGAPGVWSAGPAAPRGLRGAGVAGS
ncbi:MAG: hypothetical protein AVDCRST_MAG02-1752, partial [uncultured Rubrobacteraceae bacterium]